MALNDIQRRLDDALREKTRLEMISGRLLQELARLERNRIDTITALRQKTETEIQTLDVKLKREIDDLKKDHDRTNSLLRSNKIMVLNAERELDNAQKNENPNAASNRRTHI